MTIKEMLEQYESIKAEIQDLKNESKKQHIPLTDTVTGSSVNFPYTKHSISIKGIPEECYTTEAVISEKIRELERERVQIESFLDSVHDLSLIHICFFQSPLECQVYAQFHDFIKQNKL